MNYSLQTYCGSSNGSMIILCLPLYTLCSIDSAVSCLGMWDLSAHVYIIIFKRFIVLKTTQ